MTTGVTTGTPVVSATAARARSRPARQVARDRYPARPAVENWPTTRLGREQVWRLVTAAPFVLDNAQTQLKRLRGLTRLLDWLQDQQKQRPDAELKTVLSDALPRRFAQRLCEVWLPNRPMKQFNAPQLKEAAALLADWPLVASGTEGYRTAEVTLGGVDTDGVSSSTMMSKRVPGLFFVGEVLDVTGWLGGYNFQWAWASGHAAGMAA